MTHYYAFIHKDEASDFGITFPDFLGCVTAGRTLDEAMKMAVEALAAHIELMAEEGIAIPEPSSFEKIVSEAAAQPGAVPYLVRAPDVADRAVRLNITLPESLVRRIDERTRNRSRFLARAAEDALSKTD
jgi:predicted RNase H-like HicB family nuclease